MGSRTARCLGCLWLALLAGCGGRSGADETARGRGGALDAGGNQTIREDDEAAANDGDDDDDVTSEDDDVAASDDDVAPPEPDLPTVGVPANTPPGVVPAPVDPTPVPPTPIDPTPTVPAPVVPIDDDPPGPDTDPEPMEPGPIEPDPIDPESDPNPVLLYLAPSILNVNDGSTWATLEAPIATFDGATPWSLDGSRLVDLRAEGVVFLQRSKRGYLPSGVVAPLAGTLRRWLGNDGVLLSSGEMGDELWFVRVDGSSELVVGSAYGPITGLVASADGRHLLFNTTGDGEYPLFHVSFDGDGFSMPAPLAAVGLSPLLSPAWSSDGRWLAFGVSGGAGSGIYAWNSETPTEVTSVTPPGTPYNPLYSFAPGRNVLAVYTVNMAPELGVFGLEGGLGWQTVTSGGSTTPAYWSLDGGTLLHGPSGAGQLVPVGADGSLGLAVPFPEGGYDSCSLQWVSSTEFYFQECVGAGEALLRGTVGDGAVLVEEIAPRVAPNFARAPDSPCFVNYSSSEVRLGSFESGYVETELRMSAAPTAFAFAPNGSGFAWHEGGSVRWQAWDESCAPVADAVSLASTESTPVLMFVP